jgi:hypothetical protein
MVKKKRSKIIGIILLSFSIVIFCVGLYWWVSLKTMYGDELAWSRVYLLFMVIVFGLPSFIAGIVLVLRKRQE